MRTEEDRRPDEDETTDHRIAIIEVAGGVDLGIELIIRIRIILMIPKSKLKIMLLVRLAADL